MNTPPNFRGDQTAYIEPAMPGSGSGSGPIVTATPPPRSSDDGTLRLNDLLDGGIVHPEEWGETPASVQKAVFAADRTDDLITRLVAAHLLTPFQASALRKGNADELVIGQYRLLDVIGRGGMGVVFRGEHRHLRKMVAVKVMGHGFGDNPMALNRFFLEARAVARLQHPNIVGCMDAGRIEARRLGDEARCYYVMELVPGEDLDRHLRDYGALPPHKAASLFRQIAEALAEAHRNGLIHRDIKPHNVVVTPDWRAKLLDFGLAQHPQQQMTQPGTLLGTIGFVAPEQARDARRVDGRADIFSLGATLYLALTGREPFASSGSPLADLSRRQTDPPPRITDVRPELPTELSDVVRRMMEPNPDDRFQTASAVAAALAPFINWAPAAAGTSKPRVLIADDEDAVRDLVRSVLEAEYDCTEAADGQAALAAMAERPFDAVLLDQHMPRVDGLAVKAALDKAADGEATPPVLFISGAMHDETLGAVLSGGSVDFLRKPFSPAELRSRVRGLLARGPGASGVVPLSAVTRVSARDTVRLTAGALTRNSVPAAPSRGPDPLAPFAVGAALTLEEVGLVARGLHLRLPRYVRELAAAAPARGEYARLKDQAYLDLLESVCVLHDLGLVGVPGHILHKPGRLDADERLAMQAHVAVGAEVLTRLAARFTDALPATSLALEVVRSHHERWDGDGYPDGLAGTAVPLAARVVAVATAYDHLRTRRPHRPPLSHAQAVRLLTRESEGEFDPTLLAAFAAAAPRFDEVYQELGK